ncbi:hypothetical protein VOLCADRAFT_94817 [Volvox carteri f. nagariensis]|uniref:Uncharacterized protein n=1 Tax=Volvox carteri f. nagariensis TaxID=3068 RepID=D8U5U6_VOLCA|nr:uncharacterized protein VOLCADRAFT_94817 [Volvox carteri f. nagariensis]EFJ44818.1 hypothetical protein VOLCADRAFT_94817 [Volvox carteri f. nagariensis]|eukprot:XP_002954101.1 hypothetical protein VOLCADRAFT_94817 [Volvox carteri f. nagariensis]
MASSQQQSTPANAQPTLPQSPSGAIPTPPPPQAALDYVAELLSSGINPHITAADKLHKGNRYAPDDVAYLYKAMQDQGVLLDHLYLAPGMTVMVTKNLSASKIENGALAIVQEITESMLSLQLLDSQTIRLPRICEVNYKNGAELERKMFPVVPAFARTVHKVTDSREIGQETRHDKQESKGHFRANGHNGQQLKSSHTSPALKANPNGSRQS